MSQNSNSSDGDETIKVEKGFRCKSSDGGCSYIVEGPVPGKPGFWYVNKYVITNNFAKFSRKGLETKPLDVMEESKLIELHYDEQAFTAARTISSVKGGNLKGTGRKLKDHKPFVRSGSGGILTRRLPSGPLKLIHEAHLRVKAQVAQRQQRQQRLQTQ